MAQYKLLLPKMGESVAEATVIKWNKNPGDNIDTDETVMEIATDKVDSEVPSPVSGKLIERLYNENDVVQVGAVIAIIETPEPEAAPVYEAPQPVNEPALASYDQAPVYDQQNHTEPVENEQVYQQPNYTEPVYNEAVYQQEPNFLPVQPEVQVPFTEQLNQHTPVTEEQKSAPRFYSPLVKSIANQEGIGIAELDSIPGSGTEGRLTKDDLLNYIQNKTQTFAPPVENTWQPQFVPEQQPQFTQPEHVQQPVAQPQSEQPAPVENTQAAAKSVSGGDEIIEMDRMRRLIADHMVMSKQVSPHVTSFVEADVTNIVLWREKIKAGFESREGEKITFTPIFIEAVAKAIKDMPMINISVNGTQIIKKKDINIGMATALPSGNLIVPVIKKADELNLVGITKAVNDLAGRARNNKLKPDDIQGGTFTITNVGSFGNVMGTPIINQPQVAILAVGAIKKKPAVIETPQGDMIGIRHMMFLSLSYDHRVVDGALGGSFVRRVADYLEKWDLDRKI